MIPPISLNLDGVILLCHPATGDVEALKEILKLLRQASGLHVNLSKSSITLIDCNDEEFAQDIGHLGFPIVEMSFSFKEISLTIHRPTASQLQPLIDKMANQLPSKKPQLMQKPGSISLVKSVHNTIPIHQLKVLAPSKKTIKLMDKPECAFIWEGRAAANNGSCHVNWH
jgi:hypothetical protein